MTPTTSPPSQNRPCDVCGQPAEMIPYQEAGGCGTAIIELWRCPNGHAEYGDIVGYDSCDHPQED